MPFISKASDFVMLEKDFVLNKMPLANAAYVKVYLYILALSGSNCEYSAIANALSMLESDVVNAVKYWTEQGVLSENNGTLTFGKAQQPPADAPTPPVRKEEKPITVKKSDYTASQISDAVIAIPALRDMLAVSEELLQKPLNPSEMETLYWFYDGLGLSPEAILMLVEYCVSKGKPRLSYAEKVALSWCERGLVTPEDISRYLRDSERADEDIKYIADKMGIGGRPLANGEEQYFSKWMGEFNMSREMILLSHEYCLMQTGKLSFPYMDKILERWHSQDIYTTTAAEEEHTKHKSKQKKPASNGSEYEYTDLEQMLRGK
ncbi:MAG: DnaD domain protein [Clostridia bacterium]|nr:DnaD domain protein [Clostridia bacterium]